MGAMSGDYERKGTTNRREDGRDGDGEEDTVRRRGERRERMTFYREADQ